VSGSHPVVGSVRLAQHPSREALSEAPSGRARSVVQAKRLQPGVPFRLHDIDRPQVAGLALASGAWGSLDPRPRENSDAGAAREG